MVTVFARKPGQFKEQGYDGDFIRPFHEFDAYIHVLPTRQGMPLYSLHLVHRYQPVAIDFMPLIGRQTVSYTHLEVYKRQVPDCIRATAHLSNPVSSTHLEVYKRQVPDCIRATAHLSNPVSSTHLEVYKRQVLPTRQGMPLYSLHLVHRYQPVAIDFMPLIGRQSSDKNSLALWDMWQNYMDISKPLPDIPVLEEFRQLDPVTAEYDRRTGRNPRHWRDMDDSTFKAAILAMQDRINQLDALSRPNLMARHVRYAG
nr:hypothetical protein [Pseudomonas sp. HS-2]